ncbi:hypothetical protein LA080_013718 [Diaporthe eres]|nr:hypothetical protein LA080_013718 [Diaporthe eres]
MALTASNHFCGIGRPDSSVTSLTSMSPDRCSRRRNMETNKTNFGQMKTSPERPGGVLDGGKGEIVGLMGGYRFAPRSVSLGTAWASPSRMKGPVVQVIGPAGAIQLHDVFVLMSTGQRLRTGRSALLRATRTAMTGALHCDAASETPPPPGGSAVRRGGLQQESIHGQLRWEQAELSIPCCHSVAAFLWPETRLL